MLMPVVPLRAVWTAFHPAEVTSVDSSRSTTSCNATRQVETRPVYADQEALVVKKMSSSRNATGQAVTPGHAAREPLLLVLKKTTSTTDPVETTGDATTQAPVQADPVDSPRDVGTRSNSGLNRTSTNVMSDTVLNLNTSKSRSQRSEKNMKKISNELYCIMIEIYALYIVVLLMKVLFELFLQNTHPSCATRKKVEFKSSIKTFSRLCCAKLVILPTRLKYRVTINNPCIVFEIHALYIVVFVLKVSFEFNSNSDPRGSAWKMKVEFIYNYRVVIKNPSLITHKMVFFSAKPSSPAAFGVFPPGRATGLCLKYLYFTFHHGKRSNHTSWLTPHCLEENLL